MSERARVKGGRCDQGYNRLRMHAFSYLLTSLLNGMGAKEHVYSGSKRARGNVTIQRSQICGKMG